MSDEEAQLVAARTEADLCKRQDNQNQRRVTNTSRKQQHRALDKELDPLTARMKRLVVILVAISGYMIEPAAFYVDAVLRKKKRRVLDNDVLRGHVHNTCMNIALEDLL